MNNRNKMLYMMPNNEMENRFRDRRGRPHYNNGRFAPRRNAYDSYGMEDAYDSYNMEDYGMEDRYDRYDMEDYDMDEREDYSRSNMRPIGYGDRESRYMGGGHRSKMERGGSSGEEQELTKRDITEWLKGMKNVDGSKGAHWSMEQTEQIRKQHNIECDPVDFSIAMNMFYSDFCGVAKKMNVNNGQFYALMAKAFLDDEDSAVEDKLAAYYFAIVK